MKTKLLIPAMLLSGIAAPLAVDSLSVGSANGQAGTTIPLPFRFLNTHGIVAMQFDVVYPTAQVEAGTATAAAGAPAHQADSREIAPGERRVVFFSPSNAVIPSATAIEIPLSLKPGSPTGGPTITVRNIILTNRQGQTFAPTVNYHALDAWRQQHFSESERANANVVGDDRDPDHDELSNLMEFLFGTNPRSPNPERRPDAGLAGDPNDEELWMTFRSAKGITAAAMHAEGSVDLANWNSSGITLEPTGNEDATTMEFVARLPAGTAARKFLRLVERRTGN